MPRLLFSRLVAVALVAAVPAGCGSPPRPLPTAAPQGSAQPAESTIPSFGVPSAPIGTLPPGAVPPGGLVTPPPLATLPTYAPYPTLTTTPPTTPPSPTPSPAPKCTNGPTGAQVLAVVKGKPGIPDEDLTVHAGPYCSGSWQFTELEIKGKDDDEVEPLLVVTTGKPSSLTLVEAGADVCSNRVQDDAPKGIRVRACGF